MIAYTREHEGEVVLCVANLARSAQQVALDLSDFKGRVPIEMVGWSPFQTIGADRYVITLPGHGFYWFLLSETAQAPSWGSELPEAIAGTHDARALARGWRARSSADARSRSQRATCSPRILPQQRWFAEKSAKLERVSLVDTARFD